MGQNRTSCVWLQRGKFFGPPRDTANNKASGLEKLSCKESSA